MGLLHRSFVLLLCTGCAANPTPDAGGAADAGADAGHRLIYDAGTVFVPPPVCANFGPFGAPALLDAVNSDASDTGPWISSDGTVLYFCSARDGGTPKVYRASRASTDVPFGTPEPVVELDLPMMPTDVALSSDQLAIYFRGDGPLTSDLFVATRGSVTGPFGTPEPLATNGDASNDTAPTLRIDGLEILFTRDVSSIYRATRPTRGAAFGTPTRVDELESPDDLCCPSMMDDGLTIFFDRLAGFSWEVFTATRPSVDEPFEPATPVSVVNSDLDDIDTAISGDGRLLVFSSARGNTGRSWELWMSERSCLD